MAFTCKECLPRGQKWWADLPGSHGPCECCKRVANCVDWKGKWEPNSGTSDEPKVVAEPLDTYRYDDLDGG